MGSVARTLATLALLAAGTLPLAAFDGPTQTTPGSKKAGAAGKTPAAAENPDGADSKSKAAETAQRTIDAGIKAYEAGKSDEAVRAFDTVVRAGGLSNPQMARTLYYRGLAKRKLGKPGLAISDLTSAVYLKGGLSEHEMQEAVAARAAAYREAGIAQVPEPPHTASAPAPAPQAPSTTAGAPQISTGWTTAMTDSGPVTTGQQLARPPPPAETGRPASASASSSSSSSSSSGSGIGGFFNSITDLFGGGSSSSSSSTGDSGDTGAVTTASIINAEPSPPPAAPRASPEPTPEPSREPSPAPSASVSPPAANWTETTQVAVVEPAPAPAPPPARRPPPPPTPAPAAFSAPVVINEAPLPPPEPEPPAEPPRQRAPAPMPSIVTEAVAPSSAAPRHEAPAAFATQVAAAPQEPAQAPAAAETAPTAPAQYRVQVASVRSRSEAYALAVRLVSQHGGELEGRKPEVQEAVIGSMGTFYRVRLGPYASSEQSQQICGSLRATGFDCLVVPQ